MSRQSEITRLETAKANLKTSIRNKGVSVADTDHLDAYAAKVDAIVVATNNVYTGSTTPSSSLGKNGDIYIRI